MKTKVTMKFSISLFVILSSIAHAGLLDTKLKSDKSPKSLSQINSVYDLLEFQDKAKKNANLLQQSIQDESRYTQIKEYAYTLAIKTAIQSNLAHAQEQIDSISRQLDSIYNFTPLMINGRVVPPVITQANDLYNQETPLQIRLSGALFNIYSQARFSSTAPNWRDYLTFSTDRNAYDLIAFSATALDPKNEYERQIWVKATEQGWEQGISQSNDIILNAMDKLNRDYIGMVNFHSFVAQGKITMPIIRQYHLYDTNQKNKLIMDEKLLQIETLPEFITENKQSNKQSSPEQAISLLTKNQDKAIDSLTIPLQNNKLISQLTDGVSEPPFGQDTQYNTQNLMTVTDESQTQIDPYKTPEFLDGFTNSLKVLLGIKNAYIPAKENKSTQPTQPKKDNSKDNPNLAKPLSKAKPTILKGQFLPQTNEQTQQAIQNQQMLDDKQKQADDGYQWAGGIANGKIYIDPNTINSTK